MKNLIFISGPQGGGKTTLVNLLAGPNILVPDVQLQRDKFNVDPNYRISLKICQRAIENFIYSNMAKDNPEKIVIGNRCIYDQLVFDEIYVKKGWITEEYRKKLDEASKIFYPDWLLSPKVIILNPGYEVVKRHLEERWKKKGKKWREDDEEYIGLACKGYEQFRENSNVYYIDHEIDLRDKSETENIKLWLDQQSL